MNGASVDERPTPVALAQATGIERRGAEAVDMKLEVVVVVPVSDVDRAKNCYKALGWREDADYAADLAEALRRAAAAHGKHEEETGQADPDWPDWYAQYMVDERNAQVTGA